MNVKTLNSKLIVVILCASFAHTIESYAKDPTCNKDNQVKWNSEKACPNNTQLPPRVHPPSQVADYGFAQGSLSGDRDVVGTQVA